MYSLPTLYVGTDEKGITVNGKKYWFWTWQNKFATFVAAQDVYYSFADEGTMLCFSPGKTHARQAKVEVINNKVLKTNVLTVDY